MKVKGGREQYKRDRFNIIAAICAKFSVELVKAVKTSDPQLHSATVYRSTHKGYAKDLICKALAFRF